MRTKIFTEVLLMALVLSSAGLAQTTKNVTVEMSYDDNSFRNYRGLSDYVTQLSLYLARDYGKDLRGARLFYDGNFNLFAEYSDRFSHYHKIGLAASRSIGEKGNALNLGGNVAIRRYDSVYDYTNYVQASGYLNYKFRPEESIVTRLGYLIKYRDYENLPEFSHYEHQLFGRFSWFLPSNTSLILYGRYGLKDYQSQTIATVVADSLGSNSERGRGHGRGGTSVVYSEVQTPSTSQFIGSVKVGQSVTPSTGLSVQYLRRINLTNPARYSTIAGEVWTYNTEDDLFDDPYGYEGHEISTALTQMLPWQMIVKLGYDRYIKKYSYEAFDLEGLSLAEDRDDTRDLIWFSISKRFSQQGAFRNFQIYLDFYYLSNDSNDPYFNYDNNVFTFGSGFSF